MLLTLAGWGLITMLVTGCAQPRPAQHQLPPDNLLSMEQVIVAALLDQPGHVDKAELDRIGNRYVWRLSISKANGGRELLLYDAVVGQRLLLQPQPE